MSQTALSYSSAPFAIPTQKINISAPAFTPLSVQPTINVTQFIGIESAPQQKCQRTNSKKVFATDSSHALFPGPTQLPFPNKPNTAAKPFHYSPASEHKAAQFEPNYDSSCSGSDKLTSGSTRYSSDEDSELDGASSQFNLSPQLHHVSSVPLGASIPAQPKFKCQKSHVPAPQKQLQQPCLVPQGSSSCDEWKQKVKTELCRFWLEGATCENVLKDQGCGFAHGECELQPKKGLNKQYLTSVCKNFIDSPEKCTYGHRCIFQHPSLDVNERQSYRDMMKDNVKYTAMRMFQNINGAETLYINTYALNTPRLAVFKSIPLCKDSESSQ